MLKNHQKWQAITLILVIGLITIIIINHMYGEEIEHIVVIDLGLGMIGLILAMYVYYKEKKLEQSIKDNVENKIQEAYVNILTTIMIFEKILDDIFVDDYEQGKTELKIGNNIPIYIHHNNLNLIFSAHADVIDKNMMGRLAQHISVLDQYVNEEKIEVSQHMDNIHDMEALIEDLTKKIKNKQSINLIRDISLKICRHNYFMLFTFDEMQICIAESNNDYEKLLRDMVLLIYDFEYYLQKSPSEIVQQILTEIIDLEIALLDPKVKQNNYEEISKLLTKFSTNIKDYDLKLKQKYQQWVNHLQDYSRIFNPLLFLINIMEKIDVDHNLEKSIILRIQLILGELPKLCHMTSDVKDRIKNDLNEIQINIFSKDINLVKIYELKSYLLKQMIEIQNKHKKS